MPISGSYFYPGVYSPPAQGSGIAGVGRGPVDAYIIGGVNLSATLEPSDGTTNVELTTLSGSITSLSSTFVGANHSIVLGPVDVSRWTNIAITLVNNHATNRLESGSVEFSPNSTNWETDWDVASLAGLAVGDTKSMQITGNSRRYLRVRVIPSGSAGALTGSIDAYLHVNNG